MNGGAAAQRSLRGVKLIIMPPLDYGSSLIMVQLQFDQCDMKQTATYWLRGPMATIDRNRACTQATEQVHPVMVRNSFDVVWLR